MADQSLQYLQQIIQDVHAYVAHEPDPQAKATAAKCLQAFLTLQHQKLSGGPGGQQGGGQPQYQQPPQPAPGGGGAAAISQIMNTLGGGR